MLNTCIGGNATATDGSGEAFVCTQVGIRSLLTSGLVVSLMSGATVISPTQVVMPVYLLYAPYANSVFARALNGNLLRDVVANATLFVASTIPDVTVLALGNFWNGLQQTKNLARPMARTASASTPVTGLQKPLVQVQCTGSSEILTSSTSKLVTFPSKYHYPSVAASSWTTALAPILTNSTYNASDYINTSAFSWVDLGMSSDVGPSATGIYFIPDDAVNHDSSQPFTNTFACTVDAMWIPSQAWIDPTTDDVVHEPLSNPLEERHHFQQSHTNVILSRDWLDMMNTWSDNSEQETTFQMIGDVCTTSTDYSLMAQCLEGAMGLFIADGLARMQLRTGQLWIWNGDGIQYSFGNYSITNRSNTILDTPTEVSHFIESQLGKKEGELVQFKIDILQYGYAYGLHGTGIYIAMAILFTHVIFAIIHITTTITGGWSSRAWNNPGELIALAMNSSPTKLLQNTCAGIEDKAIWTRIMSVRETTEAHLEIVLHDEGRIKDEAAFAKTAGMEMNEGSEGTRGLSKRVINGKKYGYLG